MKGYIEQFVEEAIRAKFLNLNTLEPGIIREYICKEQKVVVERSIRRKVLLEEGKETQETTELLEDVPVVFLPVTSRFATSVPLEPGDRCLLLFNQKNINEWWFTGEEVVDSKDTRTHHISDAIALVGFQPLPQIIEKLLLDWMDVARSRDGVHRIALHDKDGAWLQSGNTHLRVSDAGFNVWRGNASMVDALIDGFSKLSTEPELIHKGTYAAVASTLTEIRGAVGIPKPEEC